MTCDRVLVDERDSVTVIVTVKVGLWLGGCGLRVTVEDGVGAEEPELLRVDAAVGDRLGE